MIREEHIGGGWEFPFVLYRPSKVTGNMPLVVHLHGAGEVGTGNEDLYKVDVHGISHIMTTTAEYPCLVLLPQCMDGSFWIAEIPNIQRFIERAIVHFGADRQRIYLTGLSMGGYGTWLTAERYPQMFAAIAPVCGGGMVWRSDVLDMPIWAFHGTDDTIVYPTETLNMIQKLRTLRSNDPEIKATFLDGVGHNAWDYAYTEELLQWLLSKKRN